MNETAHAALQAQIDRLRVLPAKLVQQAPAIVAKTVDAALRATIAAGTTPDGAPWQKTKDGKTPLRNAAAAMTCKPAGSGILVRLVGPEALHHLGKAKGEIKRQVIPIGALPDKMAEAVKDKLDALFLKLAGPS